MNSERPIAIRARYVVPIDGPIIRDGTVAVLKDRILGVGSPDEISRQFDPAAELDLGELALLPGLINAHTHLEFSDLDKPLGHPGIAFTDWIREVMSRRSTIAGNTSEQVAAIQRGIAESHENAVAAIGEISTFPGPYNATEVHVLRFLELIGTTKSRIDEAKSNAANLVSDANRGILPHVGLSPHAPYSCHIDLVEHACRVSASGNLPVAIHLAETVEELQLLAESRGALREMLEEFGVWNASAFAEPRTPRDYLERLASAHRALVVHGNYLTSDEIRFIGERRDQMSVVFCPRTHSFFGHKDYPLPEMVAANVRIALGTDSRASNPDLSLWNECKLVHELFPAINPTQMIAMATIDGAKSLGISQYFGTISRNRFARFAALSMGNLNVGSDHEIAASIMAGDIDISMQQSVARFVANN